MTGDLWGRGPPGAGVCVCVGEWVRARLGVRAGRPFLSRSVGPFPRRAGAPPFGLGRGLGLQGAASFPAEACRGGGNGGLVCRGRAWDVVIQGFTAKRTPRGGGSRGGILDARKSAVASHPRPAVGGFFCVRERVALSLEIGRSRQGSFVGLED